MKIIAPVFKFGNEDAAAAIQDAIRAAMLKMPECTRAPKAPDTPFSLDAIKRAFDNNPNARRVCQLAQPGKGYSVRRIAELADLPSNITYLHNLMRTPCKYGYFIKQHGSDKVLYVRTDKALP